MIRIIKSLVILFLIVQVSISAAQIPEGYYKETDGLKGQMLKLKLHTIIRNHTVRSYSEFRDTILPTLDEDPSNSDNIILFYKNNSIPKSDFANGNDGWNREHTWPKSHGFPEESDTTYTDAHNLRPSDASVNTDKSNKGFNDVEHTAENEQGEAPDTYTNSDFWEPRDEIKGDVARILFYMDTRYESNRLDLEIVDRKSFSGEPEIGVLFTLLNWHEQDPVDEAERSRHEGVFSYQENRNPFVDHPEWVEEIWGSTTDPNLISNQVNFNQNFGFVELGSSLSQQYNITAYNLIDDVSITVDEPFSVSFDGSTFVDSVGFSNNGSEVQTFDVYVKFEPTETNQEASAIVMNYTNGDTLSISVFGKEGAQENIAISEARTKELGTVVNISGVVIDQGNNSSNSRVIFDGTAGIVIRSFDAGNESSNLNYGDSINVTGGLDHFNNLLQVVNSPITINVIKENASIPAPQVVTIADIGEEYESELVTVENVYFIETGVFAGGGSSGNFTISDGTNELVFRIGSSSHPIVGMDIPSGIHKLTGYIGQFGEDYQLSVRSADDIVFVSDGGNPPASLITILEARSKMVGETVKITGVVIDEGNNSSHNRVIFDGTAGIVVRSFVQNNESASLMLGDSVFITGRLDEFNNWLQISDEPIEIELIKQNANLPSPQVVTIDEVDETLESELITIENVSFKETGKFAGGSSIGNFTITNNGTDLIFRIGSENHPLVGVEIPDDVYTITGFVGQFQNNYQILPRSLNDLQLIEEVLGLSSTTKAELVYPNPAYNYFQVANFSEKEYSKLYIISMGGEILEYFENFNNAISVSNLVAGTYIVVVQTNNESYSTRLVVRK